MRYYANVSKNRMIMGSLNEASVVGDYRLRCEVGDIIEERTDHDKRTTIARYRVIGKSLEGKRVALGNGPDTERI